MEQFILAPLISSPILSSIFVVLIENAIIPFWNLPESCKHFWQYAEAEFASLQFLNPFSIELSTKFLFYVNEKSLNSQLICKVEMNDSYWV